MGLKITMPKQSSIKYQESKANDKKIIAPRYRLYEMNVNDFN